MLLTLCVALSGGPRAALATDPERADFVIVGGGTAGCALAARLCEGLPHATVAVLERGHPRTAAEELRVRAVRNAFQAWRDPGVSEAWESEPNRNLENRTVLQFTGNTLGGSSSIGAAHWTKPPLETFDAKEWGFTGAPCTWACTRHVHAA